MNPHSQKELGAIHRQVTSILSEISKQDETLSGIFKPWDGVQFLALTSPEDLSFVVDGAPDLIRLLVTVRSEINRIDKAAAARNSFREKKVSETLNDDENGSVNSSTLVFWFEMIDFRFGILAHANTALVLIAEAIAQIEKYRKADFPERSKWVRRFAKKKNWITYKLPDQWQKLMPDRALYKDILDGVP